MCDRSGLVGVVGVLHEWACWRGSCVTGVGLLVG